MFFATGLVTTAAAAPAQTSATARRMAASAAGALLSSGWPGLGGHGDADVDDRKRVAEGRLGGRRLHHGQRDVAADLLGAATQEIGIGENVERREAELLAPPPGCNGDIGADSRGLAERQRKDARHPPICRVRSWRSCAAAADTSSIPPRSASSRRVSRALRRPGVSVLVSFLEQTANISMPCRVTSGGGQLADRHAVEDLAEAVRQVGRGADDLIAHGDVAHRAHRGNAFGAALEASSAALRPRGGGRHRWRPGRPAAPGTGSAAAGSRSRRHRAPRVLRFKLREDLLVRELQPRLIAAADQLLPDDIRPDPAL